MGLRILLHGHKQPLESLGDSGYDRRVRAGLLGVGLPHLVGGKIKGILLGEDGIPRKEPPDGFVEVLKLRLIDGEEN
ncbi:MAG: hypothetical protein SNJ76_12645, partial [Fimbriimonadaceae bacterium]